MSERAARLLERLLRRRTTGDAGIHVIDTPDHLHIGLRDVGGRRSPMLSRPAELRQVKLKWVSGDDGSATSPPTHVYDAFDRDAPALTTEYRIAEALPVEWRFTSVGRYIKAPDGTLGEAYLLDGTWHLVCAYGERKTLGLCNPNGGARA